MFVFLMERLFLMFKNWSNPAMFTSTTILLESSSANQKLLTEVFVEDCCEVWKEPKDSSQES